ncbi:MAG TPA: hypothetical protein DDY40_07265 [Barnesiella intestinihominis]|nr:hypothetical protein [Barnesiella intestinihominis]HCP44346.1 hypothetical protein [Barnesiella intestinihominis]
MAHKIGAEAEQIKRISVTRTFFGWERKSFVSQSFPAVSRSIAGCFATQNIGEGAKGRRG